ncbi:MAG: ABC transporter ATP-binding protein [Anaerolineae bacterium]|nr:ABC transporter ATP-binding protein [Anaerolineae bacterium]
MNVPLRQYYALLSSYLRPQIARVAALALLLFGGIGLQLVNPQIMRGFIDSARSDGPPEYLYRLALLFMGLAVLQQVVAIGTTYFGENVGWTATNFLRADLAEHCLGLDMRFHNTHTPGEMIERLDGDVTALSNFFSQFVIQVFGSAMLMLGVLVLLFREDWRVGLALTVFAVLAMAVLLRLRNIAVPHWTASREAHANLFGFLEERLSGTEDIRSAGAKPYVLLRFFQLMRDVMQKQIRAGLMVNIMVNSGEMVFAVGTAAAFAVGAYVFEAGAVSIGTVYLIFNYTMMLIWPMQRITQQLQNLQLAAAGIVRIQGLLREQPTIADGDGPDLPPGPLTVEFRHVSFSYDSDEPVLRDLDFHLEAGKVLGLLGRTGSGKTTITRLLFRLYEPQEGGIEVGGVPLGQTRLADLRRHVGMVTQNVQLFQASVRDNLTFFDPSIPDERLLAVIEELGLGSWFGSLPQGLDTELESAGGGLSTGEAQLVAFTRIFLQNPGLVILDEASSRLDPATEHLIERAVDRLMQGRTGIVIAHRLGTVQRADEIMILEEGRILEHGERHALVADPGSRFSGLLRTGLEEMLV